ncbi:IS110 family transposase, partial [Natroniella acetigena]|uniref:IS110 family transposase n=1 Tax=Natroniella acetigena TaxID=52004 RepID=UPI00200AAF9F
PTCFTKLIDKINSFDSDQKDIIFGLEDTCGLGRSLAQWLVKNNYEVKDVNPSLTKRERKHSPNPDKSDAIDAEAIANVLLSDFDELPTIKKDSNFKAIRQLNNHYNNLNKQRTQVKNRLHALLHQQYPNYEEFFSQPCEGKTALAFWDKFPHPSLLKHYGEKRLQSFLKKQAPNISDDKAAKILSLVDKDKEQDASSEIRNDLIPMLIKQLKLLNEQIDEIEIKLETAVNNSPYNNLTTMPGLGFKLAATIISRIRDIDRFTTANKLARYSGIAPAEFSSGKSRKHTNKKYGCRKLNNAFHQLALQQTVVSRNNIPRNPVAYQYYKKKLAEGKTKETALNCLKRRLVDIIFAMMKDKSDYKMPDVPEYEILNEAV